VPQLEAALPISADIAALAEIGLDALAGFVSGHAREVLDRQAAAAKASESIVQVVTTPQPAADLLIGITPGIRTLVEAAPTLGGSHSERRFHERRAARV
jgi:hexosaminidase